MNAPLICTWTGEAWQPLPRFSKHADANYVVGENYRLSIEHGRTQETHRHYFAALNEAWMQLPEDQAERWPSSEHFRKWLLVQCGYADERSIVCASKAEAQRVAAFVKPMDEYAVVTVNGPVVRVFTAQSQSHKAMGAAVFQQSKTAVLDKAAALIGVTADELTRNARAAA